MKGKIKFKIIDKMDDFIKLKEDWIDLYDNLENKEAFYDWIWIEYYIESFKKDNFRPFVVVGEEQGKVVTIAPLCIEEKKFGPIKKRFLKFIIDVTADYQCILIREDYNHYSVLKKLFKVIIENGSWDVLSLNNISYREKQAVLINEIMRKFDDKVVCYKKVDKVAPYVNIEEFEKKRNPTQYSKIKKAEMKIRQNKNVKININSEWSREIWHKLIEIHRNTWSESIYKNERYVRFYEKLFERLYESGKLQFSYVIYEGEVISGGVEFKSYKKLSGYNVYNNQKSRTLETGEILTKAIIDDCIGKYEIFDTLLGNEEYKFYSTDSVISVCDYTIIRKKQWLLRLAKKIKMLF